MISLQQRFIVPPPEQLFLRLPPVCPALRHDSLALGRSDAAAIRLIQNLPETQTGMEAQDSVRRARLMSLFT